MKRLFLLVATCVLGAAHAELTVDPIFQSHMVLQQGKPVPVHGSCTSSAPIVVKFGDTEVKASVKGKKWEAVLPPMNVDAEGKTLTITQGDDEVQLDDVLVGEVWIASGQSNMLFRLDKTDDNSVLQQPAIPGFRFYHAAPQLHTEGGAYNDELLARARENRIYEGAWHTGGEGDCPSMSAVGWYFGRKLHELLGVPVGVVHVSLGGSGMIAWMPTAVVKRKYRESLGSRWLNCKYMTAWVRERAKENLAHDLTAPHPYKPTCLFENGIRPWTHFPVAGVIWYQGESDAELQDQKQNEGLLKDLITGWRTEFKQPDMPFVMVQLPRIKDDKNGLRAYWPEFREVQDRVCKLLPRVYEIITVDLGSTSIDVHPRRKLEVGERLAATAAACVYDKKDVPYSGPVAKQASLLSEGSVVVEFDHAKGLKSADGKPVAHFELSSDGKKFYPANAEIREEKLVLTADGLRQTPKVVRYAWSTFLTPNLVNEDGLPTAPFTMQLEDKKTK